jgi:hypothetical protein
MQTRTPVPARGAAGYVIVAPLLALPDRWRQLLVSYRTGLSGPGRPTCVPARWASCRPLRVLLYHSVIGDRSSLPR